MKETSGFTEYTDEVIWYDRKNEWMPELYETASDLMRKKYGKTLPDPEKLTAWERLCCYYISPLKVDCDVSAGNMECCRRVYPLLRNRKDMRIKNQEGSQWKCRIVWENGTFPEFRGDTMNSYKTVVHEYLRLFGDCEEAPRILRINQNPGKNFGKFMPPDVYGDWEQCILDQHGYFKEQMLSQADRFFRLVHTSGNFLPVPFQDSCRSFNGPRGKGRTKDFWDLAMLRFWNWYRLQEAGKEKEAQKELEQVVGRHSAELCAKWLRLFQNEEGQPSWNRFVEDNFLQDWTEKQKEQGGYGEPLELFDGHFSSGRVLPERKEEFSEFFQRAAQRIEARGRRIGQAIKEEAERTAGWQ